MRIAIVRLTSLGDVVHTLPVAAAIRRHLAGADITWVVEEHEQALLAGNPCVDRVIVAPLRRWRREVARGRVGAVLRELRALSRSLQAGHIDTAIDVQGWGHKTSPIVLMTRAPRRIGFARAYARDALSPLFTTVHVTPPARATHVVDLNLALLAPLGIDAPVAEFTLPAWTDAEPRVDVWMASQGIQGEFVVLLPSTRGPKKLWPAASYAELADRLRAATGLPVVAAGGPGDGHVLSSLALPIFAPEPIADLAVFLRRPRLVVGNDTGPLHLSAAAGVPSLGLFGPTPGARNGPYGPSGRYIQSPTGRMTDIAVDQVLRTAVAMLEGK